MNPSEYYKQKFQRYFYPSEKYGKPTFTASFLYVEEPVGDEISSGHLINTNAEDIFPDYKILSPWHGTGIRAIRRNDKEFKCGLLLPDGEVILDFDINICMQGLTQRLGKPRPDMPWIDYEFDQELVARVQKFETENKPTLLSLFAKYPEKEVIVFKTRNRRGRIGCFTPYQTP
ncbi:MAG: hypothetical protein K5685_06555 [Bacteroidales bacterium]|nr:hypothetical protein [Bacteroidales bacterium]